MARSPGASRRARRTTVLAGALTALALTLAPASAGAATTNELYAISDTTWRTFDGATEIGQAQLVCLNDTYPADCPAEATRYGYAGGGWGGTADIAVPWIWAPDLTGATSPADGTSYRFFKEVTIPGPIIGATFAITADDGASFRINGTMVGGSTSNASPTVFDVKSYLVVGVNEIAVDATNGVICNAECTYAENPAGVAFRLGVTYQVDGSFAPTPPPTSTIGQPAAPSGPSLLPIAILAAGAVMATVVAVPSRRRR